MMNTASFPSNEEIALPPDYTDTISKALGSFIESKSATFACGGSIPISDDTKITPSSSTPVTLRWDFSKGIIRLRFPIDPAHKRDAAGLLTLNSSCQPASFGLNGEDVLDASYRKATKLDRSAFSIDFCPYEMGIIDTIAQMLLPKSSVSIKTNGNRAELYKVNNYAAPSGFFKSHFDTPRSASQFGSLVVSLPCDHHGGQLVVRHAQYSHAYDWGVEVGGKTKPAVQWAAFYSDCEHEVLEVIQGYRITLTYNLYHAPGVGDLTGNSVALDTTSVPLCLCAQDIPKRDDFMPFGGHLGIYCKHTYAHTNSDNAKAFPAILKGADMAVYTVFSALGLKLQVRAILDPDRSGLDEYLAHHEEMFCYNEGGDEEDYVPPPLATHDVVGSLGGNGFSKLRSCDGSGYEDVVGAWSGDWRKVVWANGPKKSDLDMVHMTYGNEVGIGALYSRAAILVEVPPASMRGTKGTEAEPTYLD